MESKHLLKTFLALVTLSMIAACGSGDGGGGGGGGGVTPPPAPGIVPLSTVQNIFNNNCLTACHQPGGTGFGETGLDLTAGVSYGLLFNQRTVSPNLPGVRVISLDAANSVIFRRVSGNPSFAQMPPPPNAPLSASDQALIRQWIDAGASTTGQLNAVLSGNQISAASGGPIATAAGGTGTVTLNADRTGINLTLDAGALSSFTSPVITGSHIHAQDPNSLNGPVIFDFLPATVPDPLVLSGTLTAANLNPNQTAVASFPAAVTALLGATTYFQVHTQTNPGGELRGHLGTKLFPDAPLTGDQVTTPVATPATGTGSVVINPDQDAISVNLSATGLSSTIQGAHIHARNPGSPDGPVIFDFPLRVTAPPNLTINLVLTAADLSTTQTTIGSFAQAVDAMLSGTTYFQVHTVNNPGGEIRGQILP